MMALSIAMTLFLLGCVSLPIVAPPAPEEFSIEIFLCKKIDDSGELYQPLDIASEFGPDDRDIVCFVRLKKIRRVIRLGWRWYAPDFSLFKETKELIINAEEDILDTISAIDRITVPLESKSAGQWVVAVFMDRELITRKAFSVRRRNQ